MITRRKWLQITGAGLAGCAAGWPKPAHALTEGDGGEMIVIPAGTFTMGTDEDVARRLAQQHGYHPSWLDGETPARQVELPVYAIDTYPVTNRGFAEFCEDTGHRARWRWRGGAPPDRILDHPVTGVNHADATAYAHWAGKRLPTEAEWEKAARGEGGRMFPWGDEFAPDACQWNADATTPGPRTAPVDAHPKGASPYGVMDMVGNVGEWCADGPGPGAAFIKGGCWRFHEIVNLRPAARNMSGFANNASDFYGFRCARDVE